MSNKVLDTKKFIWILVALIILIFIIFKSCEKSTNGNNFEMKIPGESVQGNESIKGATLFIDFSGSMTGFVDFAGLSNVNSIFTSVINHGLTNLDDKYTIETKCYNNSGVPGNRSQFATWMSRISNKTLFPNGTTLLHEMIEHYSNFASDSTVVIIASDLVLSFGRSKIKKENDLEYNIHHISDLGSKIYDISKCLKQKGLHIVLLQYYSDFNGKYYYNYTENLKPCEFKDTIMRNRPFYIMLIGTEDHLKNMMYNKIFDDYNNVYATFDMDNLTTQKYSIVCANSTTRSNWNIGDPDNQDDYGTIWCKGDPQSQGEFIFTCKRYIHPNYVMESQEIEFDRNVISSVKADLQNNNPNSDSLKFTVLLNEYKKITKGKTSFKIVSDVQWVKKTTFTDDVVPKDKMNSLEMRSFGFEEVIKNINKAYRGREDVVSEDIAIFNFSVNI